MKPAQADLYAYRWVPFNQDIPFEGVDFDGGELKMHIRLYPDAPGFPVISLAPAGDPDEGLSISVETVDGFTTSTVSIRIDEATIEAVLPFPNGTEPGKPLKLFYDLIIDVEPYGKRRWLEGAFYIMPGVTQ